MITSPATVVAHDARREGIVLARRAGGVRLPAGRLSAAGYPWQPARTYAARCGPVLGHVAPRVWRMRGVAGVGLMRGGAP